MYLIISYKYKEYLINSNIEYLNDVNSKLAWSIQEDKDMLEYLNTEAYRNKILKKEQAMKNKWEKVVYITSETQYQKFMKTDEKQAENDDNFNDEKENVYDNMTNYEKWIYFIFKKDIRE